MQEILMLQTVLEENKDFEKILMHPEIPKEEKLQVIETVFKGRISDALTGFFKSCGNKGTI
jgi:F-type H+-transporting ATPase subunit delta